MRFCCVILILFFTSSVQSIRDSNLMSHDQSMEFYGNIEERGNMTKPVIIGPIRVNNQNRVLANQSQTEDLQHKKKYNSTINKRHDNTDNDEQKDKKTKRKRRKNHRCIHARCHCKELRRSIIADCDGKFKVLPRFHEIPFVLERLSMRRGNLTLLPAASFNGVRAKELDLSGNNFRHSKINKSAFEGLEISLTVLSLNDCQMEDIPTLAISILKNLKLVYFEGNQFQRLTQGSFANNNRLKELHLSENKIMSISDIAFGGLNNLDFLDLSQNKLKFIENKVFSHLHKLKHLDLSRNLLEILHGDMFEGLTNLRWLKLDSNVIKTLEKNSFERLQKLKNLKLENNHIQFIDDDAFNECHRLSYLSIDLANLTRLTNDTFKGLNKLKTLNLGEFPLGLKSSVHINETPDDLFSNESSINTTDQAFHSNEAFYSGPRILGWMSALERISLTDYGGTFKGFWVGMLAEKIDFKNLNIFVVPMRQCNCHQNWVKELTSLGTYVHGFCTDGRSLSCTKHDVQNMEGGMNFLSWKNKITGEDGASDVKVYGKNNFVAVNNKAKT